MILWGVSPKPCRGNDSPGPFYKGVPAQSGQTRLKGAGGDRGKRGGVSPLSPMFFGKEKFALQAFSIHKNMNGIEEQKSPAKSDMSAGPSCQAKADAQPQRGDHAHIGDFPHAGARRETSAFSGPGLRFLRLLFFVVAHKVFQLSGKLKQIHAA